MRYLQDTIISAADASTNQSSIIIDSSYTVSASLQVIVTGSAVGTVVFQASNDYAQNPPNTQTPVNWSPIPSATVSITGPGVFLIPKTDLCYGHIRAVYTFTSGTGTITANIAKLGF